MKSILMLISSSPHTPNATAALDLAGNLKKRGNDVAIYFLQDGVFHALSGEGVAKIVAEGKVNCYCLEEDLVMRGFRRRDVAPHVLLSSYEELVDLMMEEYDSTIGIF
ncbi:MAG: DsrH/TusB family sulfur relay protein [bacterium]